MVLNFEINICEAVAKVKVESASSIVCTLLGYSSSKQAWAEKWPCNICSFFMIVMIKNINYIFLRYFHPVFKIANNM